MDFDDGTSGFFERMPMAAFSARLVRDLDGRAVSWRYERCNAAWERVTGKRRGEADGVLVTRTAEGLELEWLDLFDRAVGSGASCSLTWRSADLESRWMEIEAFALGGDRFGATFVDATERMRREAERARSDAELHSALDLLRSVFREAPAFLCVLRGPTHVFQMANERYVQLAGHRQLIGRTVAEALPEVVEQGFIQLLDEVHADDKPFVGSDVPIMLQPHAGAPLEQRFLDFVYMPLHDAHGKVWGTLCHGVDQTGRKRSEDRLRAVAEELSQADRRKSEFLATLAHELRNPLAPLRNGLQIMRIAPLDASAVTRSREMMERQVSNLVRLVDDLMDVARISGGKIELRIERSDLRTALAAAVETASPAIEAQRHALSIDIPDESIPVDMDSTRIMQVIGNILTNAAKYTPPGGNIVLSARAIGGEAVVEVSDDGVGIPAEALRSVFDFFAQVCDSAAMSQGGLGIGLSLARRLAGLHGGSVSAESDGPGKGSRFTVRLPLAQPLERRSEAATLPEPEAPAPGRLRVLVVDDNLDAGDSLAMMVEIGGHEVALARDGASGLRAARAFRPDIAFLDIGMPGMDGHELAKALRAAPECSATTLVALTGWGAQADVERSMASGFDGHLVKPAQARDVERMLDRQFGKRA